MSIEVVCPACMSVNEIDEDLVGTKVRCEECNKPFTATAKPAKKAAKPKAREEPEAPAEARVSTGPTRQQFLMSLVLAFISFLALLAVAGLGAYQIFGSKM